MKINVPDNVKFSKYVTRLQSINTCVNWFIVPRSYCTFLHDKQFHWYAIYITKCMISTFMSCLAVMNNIDFFPYMCFDI